MERPSTAVRLRRARARTVVFRQTRVQPAARVAARAGWAIAGVLLFVFALEVTKTGAGALRPLLDGMQAGGTVNGVGFGWLLSYVVLSGSPVAAVGVTLLSQDVITQVEAYGVIGGSRLGASFIVLAVGFLYYVLGRRSGDGISIGVIALVTTFTTQGPALVLGYAALRYGWLESAAPAAPAGLTSLTDALYGPAVAAIDAAVPGGLVFAAGVLILLASFAVFDRALPQLEGEADGIRRVFHALRRRELMFLMGALITLTTMSVSLSLTVLVPLALKGYIKREHIIPYVMGANITTFVDTLGASFLVGGEAAFRVVFTQMATLTAISAVILTVAYGPYRSLVLGISGWSLASRGRLATFLAAIVAAPVALLLV